MTANSGRSGPGIWPAPQELLTSTNRRTRSGCWYGELLRHGAAERVAEHVSALDTDLVEHPPRDVGDVRDPVGQHRESPTGRRPARRS